jgi:hypothetical protein
MKRNDGGSRINEKERSSGCGDTIGGRRPTWGRWPVLHGRKTSKHLRLCAELAALQPGHLDGLGKHNQSQQSGPIIGNITSPLFGSANQRAGARDLGAVGFSESANNRRLELQVRFTF